MIDSGKMRNPENPESSSKEEQKGLDKIDRAQTNRGQMGPRR